MTTITAAARSYTLNASVDTSLSAAVRNYRVNVGGVESAEVVQLNSLLVTENEYVILTENGYAIYFEGLAFVVTPNRLNAAVRDYRVRTD